MWWLGRGLGVFETNGGGRLVGCGPPLRCRDGVVGVWGEAPTRGGRIPTSLRQMEAQLSGEGVSLAEPPSTLRRTLEPTHHETVFDNLSRDPPQALKQDPRRRRLPHGGVATALRTKLVVG